MNKRIKKKQHRLVSKWLADHPQKTILVPSLQSITQQPQVFRLRRIVSTDTVEFLGENFESHLKNLFYRDFEDVVKSCMAVQEITTKEERIVNHQQTFVATLKLIDI